MNFENYRTEFAYKGKAIYNTLFELHSQNIKTKKQTFAVNNLEKILKATFKISSKIGFHEMSLRDLCRETGLSMGGIYSCIGSKDIIALMIKDMVKKVTIEVIETAQKNPDSSIALKEMTQNLVYTTQIMQPWFYFLYFETRSLPAHEQEDSKQIELFMISSLERLLIKVIDNKNVEQPGYNFIATTMIAMIQERYLKNWKYKNHTLSIDEFAAETLSIALKALKN